MNQSLRLLTVLLGPCLFAACQQSAEIGAYQQRFKQLGYRPYYPPIGNVQNLNDWNKYGPGVILRDSTHEYYQGASTIIGQAGLRAAANKANWSPEGRLSGTKASGYDFDGNGGWSLDAVNRIAGTIGVKRDTTVELQLGNVWVSNPLGEGDMHADLAKAPLDSNARAGLRRGSFSCVLSALWADSVSYTFKQSSQNGAGANYQLTAPEIAALQAKGYSVNNNSIQVSSPTFIGYLPLPNARADVTPKR
jgi:hypothetical protein